MIIEDESAREFVDRILADPSPVVTKQSDIEMIKSIRVTCPQCGELPDSPYPSTSDARTAQRNHWRDHRDERL
jgi:hypothetical protein